MRQVLCSFSTNSIAPKIQRGEYLYWNITVHMWLTRRELFSPRCFVMHEPGVVPLQHRFWCSEGLVWWVSVMKHISGYVVDGRELLSPHCFVMHGLGVVPLHHRYCSRKDSVWWVSVMKHISGYVIDGERTSLTTLLCNAWARCCVPSAPILFP